MKLIGRTQSRDLAVRKLYSIEITGDIDFDDLDEYATNLVKGVIDSKDKIDEIITNCLVGYKINRLNYVDLSIIRVATYELMNNLEAKAVVINEAIVLTKLYTNLDDDKAKAFNNKLLDNIAKYLESK